MQKLLIVFPFVFGMITIAHAQVKESFDSNSWQWTEYSTRRGRAYIIDGVMRLESNSNNTSLANVLGSVATHSFLPMDPVKGFDLKCTASLKRFMGKIRLGIILDYVDDMNCLIFVIEGDCAGLYKMKEGKIVGRQQNLFKIQKGKNRINLDIEIIYQGGELEFRVNDVQALMCKYVPIISNGFGFFAFGRCKVDFDDVEVIN